jgi:Rod binding domain-containing protein
MSTIDIGQTLNVTEHGSAGATMNKDSLDPQLAGGHKLRKAAGEFESMLLANLWKSMKTTFTTEDGDLDDAAHDTLEDWGIQAMSDAVGKNGGLGIARLILKDLGSKSGP